MKKLIIMCAAAAIGASLNAASVSWQIGNARIPVAADVAIDQAGIQTTTDSAKFAAGALTISLYWLDGSDWTFIKSGVTTGDGVMAADTFWSQAEAVANRDASGNAYYKIVAQYETATGVYDFSQESGAVSLANIESKAVKATFNMNNGTWNYTANAVPEPTSGLLMLLGVAGLALRRRRA